MNSCYKNIFNRFAHMYFLVDILSFGLTHHFRKKAIRKIEQVKSGTILDLMCGTGNNLYFLQNKNIEYTGIDLSHKMLDRAKAKTKGKKNITFLENNLFQFNNELRKFDYILCSYGLKCIPEKKYNEFVDVVDNHLEINGRFSMVEIQLPQTAIFKNILLIYFKLFCQFIFLLTTGTTTPVKALLNALRHKVNTDQLKDLFNSKGIDCTVEKNLDNSLILISGIKKIKS